MDEDITIIADSTLDQISGFIIQKSENIILEVIDNLDNPSKSLLKSNHDENQYTGPVKYDLASKYTCSLCGDDFVSTKPKICDKSVICVLCSINLENDAQNKPQKKSYQCEVCSKTFNHKNTWRLHQASHDSQTPWKCEYCFKGFKQQFYLNVHLRHHTGEKPFICNVCGHTFFKNSSLNIHLRTHTNTKPHKCLYCPKAFCNRSDLVKHIRSHTGEKPYPCTMCDKKFGRNSHLQRHMNLHQKK